MSLDLVLDARIFGLPIAQGRPRARIFRDRAGQPRVSMYDPANSRDWKRTVLSQCLDRKPPAPVEGPLRMRLEFYLPRPVSLPKREQHHVKRPDVDNLVKSIKDCLRQVVYRDDSQIVELLASKRYSPAPGVSIRIERILAPLPAPPAQAELISAL